MDIVGEETNSQEEESFELVFEEEEIEHDSGREEGGTLFCSEDFENFSAQVNTTADHSYAGAGSANRGEQRTHVLSVSLPRVGERSYSSSVAGPSTSNLNIRTEESKRQPQKRSASIAGIVRENCQLDGRKLRGYVMEQFQATPLRSRLLHDIYPIPDGQRSVECCDNIVRKALRGRQRFDNTLIIVAHHKDHIHAVHDCSYSNNSCRCVFTRSLKNAVSRTVDYSTISNVNRSNRQYRAVSHER